MNVTDQVVILSAELSTLSNDENSKRTTILENVLKDCNMAFNKAEGVYKGHAEDSFVVRVRNQDEIISLEDFAFKNFNQESILHVDANQEAYLIFQNGNTERLGRLVQVSRDEAIKQDAFTILNGEYYITKPR